MRIKNCSKAFKALYRKINSNEHVKSVKDYTGKYYKHIGSAAVIAILIGLCAGTLISNASKKNVPVGVMITVSDVAAGRKALAGNSFEVASTTYMQMQTAIYEADQLAEIEKSEKQIEEILASRQQGKKEQVAIEQLTAEDYKAPEDVAPVSLVTPSESGASASSSGTPYTESVVTYADENGVYELVGTFTLTAYCPCPICCGQYSNMENPTTASGTRATAGRTVAADTSRLPFGTKLVINGQVYTVEDVGGAIKGNKIDIYFNTHQEAINFGRQSAEVYKVIE